MSFNVEQERKMMLESRGRVTLRYSRIMINSLLSQFWFHFPLRFPF